MTGRVKILRFDPEKDAAPKWQEYEYPYEPGMTVLDVVNYVHRHLDGTLSFAYSCRNSHCGLCSACVDGRPVLMCREPARPEMAVEPLRNVPVVRDLQVDLDAYTRREDSLRTFLERVMERGQGPEQVDMEAFAAFRVASRCVRCLNCVSRCPVYPADPHGYAGPAMLVRLARHLFDPRDGLNRELVACDEGLYECTGCGACSTVCPHDLDPSGVIAGMKVKAARAGLLPAAVSDLAAALPQAGSAFPVPRGRTTFLQDTPEVVRARGETRGAVGLFVGCLINTHPRLRRVAESAVQVLSAAGWEVVIPSGQVCCGLPLQEVGLGERATSLVRKNRDAFAGLGLDAVVTICSGCGHTAKTFWPTSGGTLPFRIYDFSEFLAQILDGAARDLFGRVAGLSSVTYHDPCTLSRGQGVREEPRRLLRLVPGLELREMAEPDRCCGGGGEVPLTNPALAEAMISHKAGMVGDTGAQAVVTACPTCMRQFAGALQKKRLPVEVLHVADVLARSLERR
ncbi:MAG: fumarate reductase (CoM/CoB) subunit TfrB [Bacillota bacterium]